MYKKDKYLVFPGSSRDSVLPEEVGSALGGALEGLLVVPRFNLLRMARRQDFGDRHAAEFGGARVHGRGQKPVLKGVRQCGGLVIQNPRDQADQGVRNHRRRQFTSAQNIVPNTDFVCDKVVL